MQSILKLGKSRGKGVVFLITIFTFFKNWVGQSGKSKLWHVYPCYYGNDQKYILVIDMLACFVSI